MVVNREKTELTAARQRPLIILLLLIGLVLPIYTNTFQVPWHYDDQPNILANPRLQLERLEVKSVWQTFFAQAGKNRFFRPLSSLSLALNWYVGRDDTFGYHVVNVSLHLLTAFILYLTILLLFRTPLLAPRFTDREGFFVALLGAALWAVNPIHTQAVTYIVQRMAQMAALFYIAGLFFYLKARLVADARGRWYGAAAGLMFLAAVGSKENAIVFPAALLLLEAIFFNTSSSGKKWRPWVWGVVSVGAGVAGLVVFAGGDPLFFLGGYQGRPFTFSERVLTEPRIVLFYLSQIFYPLPSRLSVAHDVQLSRSLFEPWTTLGAIALIGTLVLLALRCRRRWPLFAFGLLFYFLNHLVESSVVPLELIFEHRNYLPALFLFVPLASGVGSLLKRYRSGNPVVFWAVFLCVTAVLVAWGRFTYERNQVWQSAEVLWYDAMRKAPLQAGPVNNVAVALGWGEKATPARKELARRLLSKAAAMEHPLLAFRARVYDNLGTISADLGEFEGAEAAFRQAVAMDPGFLKARHNLTRFLARTSRFEEALSQADELVRRAGADARPDYYRTRGFVHLWMGQPETALADFHQALIREPYNSPLTLLYAGCALSRVGRYPRAERFYKLAQAGQPLRALTLFLLIENSVRAAGPAAAERYAGILFSAFDIYDILQSLKRLPLTGQTVPLDTILVAPVINEVLAAIARQARDEGILLP